MDTRSEHLSGLSLERNAPSCPIYILGIGNEVCFFQPDSENLITLKTPDLPFEIRKGEIYRLCRGLIDQYSDCEMDLIMNKSKRGYDREGYEKYVLPRLQLGSRVRDYEQRCAQITSLSPLKLTTAMRDPFLTQLKLWTEAGEAFHVKVEGKSGEGRCTLFCSPLTAIPSSLKVGDRLDIDLDSDKVPVVTRVLDKCRAKGFDGIDWEPLDMLYGERGSRVHRAPNLDIIPDNKIAKDLNDEQREALARYLSGDSRMNAVESPPGSGKTSVAVAMVSSYEGPGTQLVLSTANEPMYNFVEKLAKIVSRHSKKVAHLIAPSREVTRPTPFSLMQDGNGDLIDQFSKLCDDYKGADRKQKRKIKRNVMKLRVKTIKSCSEVPNVLVATVDTILAKVLGGGGDAIQKALGDVRRIVVDEASQMTEAQLNALVLCFSRATFTLIGDSKQLPPYKYNRGELVSEMSSRSALDCVRASQNVPITQFRRVYRGAPSLISAINHTFYDGKLISMKPESGRNPVECFTKNRNSRCVLFKINGVSKRSGTSRSNKMELKALLKIIEQLGKEGYGSDSIMIISYYEAQRNSVQLALPGFEIHTVDSAQGREKEIVIVLTTQDCVPATGGFLTCPYRCNVALSRPQEALIVLANPNLLESEPFSRALSPKYFKHCDAL